MTAELCPKPGLARRSEGFAAMKAAAEHASVTPMTRIDLDRVIVLGTQDISQGARLLLVFYAAHLAVEELKAGRTAVYPGAARACAFLGISASSLKRYKRELEDHGYILRRYDNRNRPLKDGAIDLRPLIARKEELSGRIAEIDARLAAERTEQAEAAAGSDLTPRGLRADPLNGEDKILQNCSLEKGSEGRLTGRVGSEPESPGRDDPGVIAATLASAPKLRQTLPCLTEETPPEAALGLLLAALPALFPADTPQSIANTGRRGAQRLGFALFPAVAIAVEDPEVRAPSAYLGRLVMRAESYDAASSLKRLAELNPEPPTLPSHGEETADALVRAFAEAAGREAAASYLAPEVAEIVSDQKGNLSVRFSSRMAFSRIKERHAPALLELARHLGHQALELRHQSDAGGLPSLPPRRE